MVSPTIKIQGYLAKAVGVVTLLFCLAFSSAATAQSVSDQSVVSINVSEGIQISKIDDWLFGIFSATDTIPFWNYQYDYLCVFNSTGTYSLQLISQNGGPSLYMESGSGDQMAYELWVVSLTAGGTFNYDGPHSGTNLTFNGLTGSTSQTCAGDPLGGHNLFITPLVRAADFNPAPPGIYRDVMTMVVTPE